MQDPKTAKAAPEMNDTVGESYVKWRARGRQILTGGCEPYVVP